MTMDTSDSIRSVVLRRSSDSGLGFSIMGGAGFEFPPVIYGIEKDSPAARSGLLEAGDIILAINEREVVRLSTKEVLKCLRLSGDIVNIKYKRDPQVVIRVKEFLSTPPLFLEGIDTQSFRTTATTKVTVTPSSPLFKGNGKCKLKPATVPNVNIPTGVGFSPVKKKSPPKVLSPRDEIDCSKVNYHNVTLSDDIFVNNAHSSVTSTTSPSLFQPTTKSLIPVRSPTHSTNGEKNGSNCGLKTKSNTAPSSASGGSGNRKNYETFVMTGDAILNVSKLRNDDTICSTKPSSKFGPVSHGPAPPHQIYSSPRPCKTNAGSPPQQHHIPLTTTSTVFNPESETSISPPLPPPPTSDSTSTSTDSITHITVKSDNLPPPPPSLMMEDERAAQSSNGLADHPVVGGNESNVNKFQNGTPLKGTNNEDTSISSSVMTDSGDDEDGLEIDTDTEEKRRKLSSNKFPMEFEPQIPTGEKERYNEYVLINGTGTMDEKKMSEPEALGYEQMGRAESEEDVACESDVEEESTPHPATSRKKLKSGDSSGDSDGSDVESMRVAVTKAVDLPSAERLAKRLYQLDGFKVSDVWRQLSKANDFSREVATYFLRHFDFDKQPLDVALRKFLNMCPLRGETQERERVLTYFSNRFVECNPNYASSDAVHTLACALMLLNTDMYSSGLSRERRMSCKDFVANLVGLNDGSNFPEHVLKKLYHSIKSKPLASPKEVEDDEMSKDAVVPIDSGIIVNQKEFKRGYLRRKSIFEQGGKKTPLGKRSWKLYFCRLRELLLSLAPDETSKASVVQGIQPLKLHHALAGIATDYRKRPFVFSLTLADKSKFLFQSSDIREMHSWIDNLNLNSAKFSSPALDPPCGSTKKFEKPLLPSAISGLSSRDQLVCNQGALTKWEEELEQLNEAGGGCKRSNCTKREMKERSEFYKWEMSRYRSYVEVLERHLSDLNGSGVSSEDLVELQVLPNPPSVLIELDENGS